MATTSTFTFCWLASVVAAVAAGRAGSGRKNLLFFIADDLRPQLNKVVASPTPRSATHRSAVPAVRALTRSGVLKCGVGLYSPTVSPSC